MQKSALKLWPKVFAYGLSLVRDRDHAEDLCQETYLRFFSMKRPVDSTRPLLPLLLVIIRNLVATEARHSKHWAIDNEGVADGDQLDSHESPAWKKAAEEEERTAVQQALDRLSPDWRSALFLKDGLGFSYKEIGDVIKRSEDSVRTLLHRARNKVRELLKSHGTDERRAQ